MNKCNCKHQNCKHNGYIQPPRSVSKKKLTTYVPPGVQMLCESEQKLSYKNPSSHINTPVLILPNKLSCFGDNLKLGSQQPFESTQHSSYKQWKTPNKLIVVKPKHCVNFFGYGPMEFNTTHQIEFKQKNGSDKSKKNLAVYLY